MANGNPANSVGSNRIAQPTAAATIRLPLQNWPTLIRPLNEKSSQTIGMMRERIESKDMRIDLSDPMPFVDNKNSMP